MCLLGMFIDVFCVRFSGLIHWAPPLFSELMREGGRVVVFEWKRRLRIIESEFPIVIAT